MTRIYYGCDEVPMGWERYFALCDALEIPHSEKFPSISTLNRWRVDSPKGFAFIPHAVPELMPAMMAATARGEGKMTDAVREAWAATEERAQALAAKAILMRTPLDFFPSTGNRQLIEAMGAELLADSKRVVIWEAIGSWPVEESREFAEANGFCFAIDPFIAAQEQIPFTRGDACFVVTERAALRRNFDQFDMEQLVEWAGSYDRAFVLFRGQYKFRHAKELKLVIEYEDT